MFPPNILGASGSKRHGYHLPEVKAIVLDVSLSKEKNRLSILAE
jgi:hypothetical protein